MPHGYFVCLMLAPNSELFMETMNPYAEATMKNSKIPKELSKSIGEKLEKFVWKNSAMWTAVALGLCLI